MDKVHGVFDLPGVPSFSGWRKLSSFSPELNDLEGQVLFLDVDLVITDIPYGQASSWTTGGLPGEHSPAAQMLETLLPLLSRHAVVAVASNRKQQVQHPSYSRVEQWKVGKRRVSFLTRNG